jgi:hypothetical protein
VHQNIISNFIINFISKPINLNFDNQINPEIIISNNFSKLFENLKLNTIE